MSIYESMFILRHDIGEEEKEELLAKISNTVTNNGGDLIKIDPWGKRKLAYTINKVHREGEYFLMYFNGDEKIIREMEHIYRISDHVLRFMNVRQDKIHLEEKLEEGLEESLEEKLPD